MEREPSREGAVDQQLSSLRSELEGNLATIRRYQRNVDAQLDDILALERAFTGADNPQSDIDRKLMNVFRIGSLILETSAFDEVSESASFRHIEPNVRAAMTDWQSVKSLILRVDQDALNYRMSAVNHLSKALAFGPMVKNLAPEFEPATNGPLRNDPARLAKDPEMHNFLALRYGIETQKLQYARQLERSTERLIALLK